MLLKAVQTLTRVHIPPLTAAALLCVLLLLVSVVSLLLEATASNLLGSNRMEAAAPSS